MKIEVLTILPALLHSYLQGGMIGRAIREKLLKVSVRNVRDFTTDKHHTTDDRPYGGGPGQVMKAEPLALAVESLGKIQNSRTIFLTPQGKPFSVNTAKRLSKYKRLILVCGRYEGVDQRFRDMYVDEEISIGDYVLTGGELPALVVLDAVARFIPGVLGNDKSAKCDSFSTDSSCLADSSCSTQLLEHPQYTKPREFRGMEVPKVLLSGNHKKITEWQLAQSLKKTKKVRPDLLDKKIGDKN